MNYDYAMNNAGTISDELRRVLIDGSVLIDDPEILPSYSKDQSQLASAGSPIALILAKSAQDIAATLKFAYARQIPVVTRGAGSGLSGGANAIEGCIIISLEKMNQVINIDRENLIARVEAGVINKDLDDQVSALGLAYLPDPASREWSTIGGNVATNAGGMCCVKYGVTAQHVRALQVVLADGEIIEIGHATKKSVTHLDLLHLIIGSEGTLGIVTEITVALAVRPKPATTLIATFKDVESAAAVVPQLISLNPSMLEIIDETTIKAVESWKPLGFEGVGAALIMQSDESPLICKSAAEIAESNGAMDATYSDDPRDSADLIAMRKLAYPALERLGVALLDDVAVPITMIAPLVRRVSEIAKKYQLLIGIFGHAGDGNMHPTIVYDHGDLAAAERAKTAFLAIIEAAQELGGTASGEHGIGSIKIESVRAETSDRLISLQRQIKSLFDPQGILNPGKKIP